MPNHGIDPMDLDEGIRDAVVLLWTGGFRTFTSCEGGKGHSFQHETIGLELEGDYPRFHKKFVRFLRSRGMESFTISLVTDYHPDYPEGKRCVYLSGLDILSERKNVNRRFKNRSESALQKQPGWWGHFRPNGYDWQASPALGVVVLRVRRDRSAFPSVGRDLSAWDPVGAIAGFEVSAAAGGGGWCRRR